MELKEYYTVKEAAEFIGCTEKDLRAAIRSGDLHAEKQKLEGHSKPVLAILGIDVFLVKCAGFQREARTRCEEICDMSFGAFLTTKRLMGPVAGKTQPTFHDVAKHYTEMINSMCELAAVIYNWRELVAKTCGADSAEPTYFPG